MEPIHITLRGRPITKKNSQRIVRAGGFKKIIPSEQFERYEEQCVYQLMRVKKVKNKPLNMQCVYYMPTRHRVDLVNLLEATCDILVSANIIEDDNCKIIAGHDGSRVLYDKEDPRVEITLTEVSDEG
ncbi:RusA family crossover junction endodeoxyribonuclease [Peptoniphilus sp. HCN-40583]|uniref:RusA family crossover junction endodeoxyribonuclease n=1 Tax=Peptoniphilus sp. HCN-40583 TaxID=3134662 RepID=UPI0030C46707